MIPYRNYNLQGLDFFKFCHVIFISLGLSAFDIDENNQWWMLDALFIVPDANGDKHVHYSLPLCFHYDLQSHCPWLILV